MKFIITTATAVQKIKSAAKAIALKSEISHTKALEQAAQEAGYESWFHVQRCLKDRDLTTKSTLVTSIKDQVSSYWNILSKLAHAPIKVNDAKGRVFHDVSIDGLRFKGQVLPTGDIAIIKFRRLGSLWIDEGFVSIGAASIRRCNPLKNAERSQWWICKYSSDEPRLNLQGMTEEGRNALAYEFGLPVIPNVLSSNGPADPHLPWSTFVHGKEQALFYFSPAFAKLAEWAKHHPRIAKSSSVNCYHLRNWLEEIAEYARQ